MIHCILILTTKGTLNILDTCAGSMAIYKTIYFLKDKNEGFNKKRSPGGYLGSGKKKTQNIYIAVFIIDTDI